MTDLGEIMLNRLVLTLISAILLTVFPLQVWAETSNTRKVMVLPFDTSSAHDHAYLADTVRGMVVSRLAAKPEVEIIDFDLNDPKIGSLIKGAADQPGESVFSSTDTDYILTGALYGIQSRMQIQVALTSENVSKPVNFSVMAQSGADLFTAVDNLVDDIAVKGLGVNVTQQVYSSGSGGAGVDGISGFGTVHPERTYKRGIYAGSIVADEADRFKALGVRKSATLADTLVSMITGDVDNDGTIEIIAVSRQTLTVYRFDDERFSTIAELDLGSRYKAHAISSADLDGDGKDELYISGNIKQDASSKIYSWSKTGGFKPLLQDIPWYIRPVKRPDGTVILAGQKANDDPVKGYLDSNISELRLGNNFGSVAEKNRLVLPANIGLFNFEWVDLEGDGVWEIVAISNLEKILVYDLNNSLMWVSEKDYGGSRNFFGLPKSASADFQDMIALDNERESDRVYAYVPARIVVVDFEGDGMQEIIVSNNERMWSRLLLDNRMYDGGSVACLGWRESGMAELWRTNRVEGYIADYSFVLESVDAKNVTGTRQGTLYLSQIPDAILGRLLPVDETKVLKYKFNIENRP